MRVIVLLLVGLITLGTATGRAAAQELRVATVERPPFSFTDIRGDTGFSLDLWAALAHDLGQGYTVVRVDSFSEMLELVETGAVDAAVANISITAAREARMDFSQPIFEAGLQIMMPARGASGSPLFQALFSRDLLLAVAVAFAVLFAVGMLMWRFERGRQSYFDLPARKAAFPAFWWALNLVVNGGFEERVPRSWAGRLFGVILVVSSLFIVSIFVANITAALTVDAIRNSVNSVNDLAGRRVGTTGGSTASAFLEARDIRHETFADFAALAAAFEAGQLDAVVFDAPILAYYVKTSGQGIGALTGPVFQRENYGIALPSGSELAEPLNQSLLRLRENGTYDTLYREWFGAGGS